MFCAWTSLVAQWIRIHLPMQGTWVQSLVQEDSTCHKATKPVGQTTDLSSRTHMPQLLKPWDPGAHALQQEG